MRHTQFAVCGDLVDNLKSYAVPSGCLAIGTPNADKISLSDPLDLGHLHQPYHRHIPSAAELLRMVSEGGWQVVEFRLSAYVDTKVPFVNTAFVSRFLKSGGGFLDAGFEHATPRYFLANPSLIFWGLSGSFFSRKTDMVVVARAPS